MLSPNDLVLDLLKGFNGHIPDLIMWINHLAPST